MLLICLIGMVNIANAYDFEVDGIYYNKSGTNATVTSGTNKYTGSVVIPSSVSYNGTTYVVTAIGNNAFSNCSQLTAVTIPDAVTSIGNEAFYFCFGLTSITIGKSVTSIGDYAFFACYSLPEVTIPEAVTSIGNEAFAGCAGLAEVTIPKAVTSIGILAFNGCWRLNTVYFNAVNCGNAEYCFGGFGGYEYCPIERIVFGNDVTTIPGSFASGLIGLTSITIGKSVSSIGDYAFSNCSGLIEVTIPDAMTFIGKRAFSNCMGLKTITCWALEPPTLGDNEVFNGTPSDMMVFVPVESLYKYESTSGWNQFEILPISDAKSLTVNLPTSANVEDFAQMRLDLQSVDKASHYYIISDKSSYTFNGIKSNSTCNVTLSNQYGDMFGKIENIQVRDQNVQVTFASLIMPQDVTIIVKTPNGQDVTTQCKITWFNEIDEILLQGNPIKKLPPARKLKYQVTLPAELSTAYTLPAVDTYTVIDGENTIVCQLSNITQTQLSGKVNDATNNLPLYGATISAVQSFEGNNTKTITAQTDNQGGFLMEVAAVHTTLTVAANGYISQTVDCDMADESNVIIPDVALSPITGAVININLTYTSAHAEGETAETQNWYSDYSNVDYEVYNKTSGHALTNVSVQFPQIVLMEEVNDGDVLELTATSRKNAFKPVKTTVTINQQEATATFNILEKGKLSAIFKKNINRQVTGTLYDSGGKMIKSINYAGDALTMDNLADGYYKLVTMGKSEFFNSIYDLELFAATGLQSGVDYVENEVTITNGLISQVTINEVPYFDETKLYYTGQNTFFSVNKSNIVVGNYLTFRTQVDFNELYANQVNDVLLIIDLPESCPLYENSVMIGSNTGSYTINGNRITIPLVNYIDVIRFCAIPTQSGEFAPSAFVQFNLNGKTITQPIGSVNYKALGLSINVPPTTAETAIFVSGTTIGGACDIAIYDDDVLIGQTTSLANGFWTTTCELHEPYNLSRHNIYAIITTKQGLVLKTEVPTCIYNKNSIEVSQVHMLNNGIHIVFDFKNPSTSNLFYTYNPSYNKFTFNISFTNNDTSLVQNVVLYVKSQQGTWSSLNAAYDDITDSWVTSGTFNINSLPVNVAVDYTFVNEDVIEWAPVDAAIDNIDNAFEEEDSVIAEIDQIIDQLTESDLTPSEIDTAIDDILIHTSVIRSHGEEVIIDPKDKNVLDSVMNIPDPEEKKRAADDVLKNRDTIPSPDYLALENSLNNPIDTIIPPKDPWKDPEISVNGPGPKSFGENDSLFKDIDVQDRVLICGGIRVNMRDVIDYPDDSNEGYHQWIQDLQSMITRNLAFMPADGLSIYKNIVVAEVGRSHRELVFDCLLLKLFLPDLSHDSETFKAQVQNIRESAIQHTRARGTLRTVNTINNVAAGASAFQGGWNIGSDLRDGIQVNNEWNSLIGIIEKCDDPNAPTIASLAREHQRWIRTRYISKGIADFGTTCLDIGGAALAPETAGLSLALNLGSFAINLATTHWQNQFTQTNSKNYKEVVNMYQNLNCSENNGSDPLPNDGDMNHWHIYPGPDMTFGIDPSGFVYEGVPSNRLQGVTATCYYKETVEDMYGDEHEEVVLWDAENYGQENPLYTDENGYYRWDVPIGMWQVKYEKEGYETTYSDWLPVPPPQLDVNIGMVQMRQPEVINARAYPKAVELEFDKYMLPETLTTDNITVSVNGTNVSGTIELLNAELDDPSAITSLRRAPGTGLTFASRVRFNADRPFNADKVTLHVKQDVKSYADLEMNEDYEAVLDVELEMQEIVADSVIIVPYLDSKQITVAVLPAAASAGKVISVASTSPMIVTTDAEQYTLDSNGEAAITVNGGLPGMTSLLYSIEGYNLTAATLVNVLTENQMTVLAPTATIASGSEVEKGTPVYLKCATPGATIYYTLDGSCPCDPSPARMVYDGSPIIINDDITIKAMATAPDLYDSDVATFVYRVGIDGKRGDVNNDGEVNIVDVNVVINIILGRTVDDQTLQRADVNKDGEINIIDVNDIINIILSPANAVKLKVNCDDQLHINDLRLKPGEVRTLNVTLDHADRYSAMQCDLVLPAGLTLIGVNGVGDNVERFGRMDENTTRVVTYSMNKRPFAGIDQTVLTLSVRADAAFASLSEILMENVVLSDNEDQAWRVADCVVKVNNASGVDDLSAIADRVWVEGHSLCINTQQDGTAHLITVNGIALLLRVTAGVTRYDLEPGIYVVVLNGNSYKIVVRN